MTDKNSKLTELTIKETSDLLDKKEVSAVEVAGAYLERIKKAEPEVHAYLSVTEKEAKKAAEEADKRRKKGSTLSKLDGIPASIKDVLLTKDIKTTAASKMLENYIPLENATSVQRLVDGGVVVLGKNNCDAWAHGSSTENSDFGPSKNPWDTSRVPGGSSGGSAAAVAANECAYSIGTDTGGSIRQPAGFCGVVGLKPTYGLVSRYGLIAMASSLDVVGPITKTVYDNALVLNQIAGADPKDATSKGNAPDYLKNIDRGIKGLKIGLPKEYFGKGLNPFVKDAVTLAAKTFEKLGAKIVDVSLPNTEYGIATYYVIQPAEVSSNLGRYDGIKYGYSAKESKNLIDHYFKSRTEGFGDEAKRRIMLGTYVLSAGYYEAYYAKAMKVRTVIKRDFEDAYKKCDVILTPTAPTTAFKFGEHSKDPLSMYLEDVYTVTANLAGVPGLALPCGMAASENRKQLTVNKKPIASSQKQEAPALPVGMQLLGPHFTEDVLFRVGHAFEEATKNEEWRKIKKEV